MWEHPLTVLPDGRQQQQLQQRPRRQSLARVSRKQQAFDQGLGVQWAHPPRVLPDPARRRVLQHAAVVPHAAAHGASEQQLQQHLLLVQPEQQQFQIGPAAATAVATVTAAQEVQVQAQVQAQMLAMLHDPQAQAQVQAWVLALLHGTQAQVVALVRASLEQHRPQEEMQQLCEDLLQAQEDLHWRLHLQPQEQQVQQQVQQQQQIVVATLVRDHHVDDEFSAEALEAIDLFIEEFYQHSQPQPETEQEWEGQVNWAELERETVD